VASACVGRVWRESACAAAGGGNDEVEVGGDNSMTLSDESKMTIDSLTLEELRMEVLLENKSRF
jgi:hypothetical protein